MSSGHDHSHARGKRIGYTIALNLGITIVQVIGGLLTGSLSLLSDAAHNFSDVIALIISGIAEKLSRKEYSFKQTFGYKRSEVIAAVINVCTIIVIAVNILLEAIDRIGEPAQIAGTTVMLLAGLSIVVNGISVLIVKGDADESMNMKSAYLHLFSDMLTSVAVLVGGAIMYYWNIFWIDSLISVAIALYLIYSSVSLLIETIKVLMQFTPDEVDLVTVKMKVEEIDGVNNMHHVHVWKLTDNDIRLEAHIDICQDMRLSEVGVILDAIKVLLANELGINHAVLEPEFE